MFFILAKTVGFFALISNSLAMIGLVGLVLMWLRRARLGRALVVISLVLLAICGLSPLGNILMYPLEQRFPPWDASRGAPDGIIVLGGMFDTLASTERGVVSLIDSAERLTEAVALARRYPHARIVFSGGSGALIYKSVTEASLALRVFDSLGIARERIIVDDRSRDTAENAADTKAVVQPKPGERWLLVTSAFHMPRAVGVFRRAGFPVEAYPVDWRTPGRASLWRPFRSIADGLKRTDTATREWSGLFAYWLTGRTSELFPRP